MESHVLLLLFTLEVGSNKRAGSLCACPRLIQIFNVDLMGSFLEGSVKVLKLFVGVGR